MENDLGSPLLDRSNRRRQPSTSENDTVNEAGNYCVSDEYIVTDIGDSAQLVAQQQRWDLNYREAAIYLQEGENNDKFSAHPSRQVDLRAYMIAHSTAFYLLTLGAALLLLTLAFLEPPSVSSTTVPIMVHGSLEVLALLIIASELGMKVKRLGVGMFVHHVRTMIKAVVLVVMFMEAVTVMARQQSHIRVTRALRPIFLLDVHYCRGVRRFIRQIFQSLSPIVDMLCLLLFFVLLFAILGFYLFSHLRDGYFDNFVDSFISLFVLLTSANFPDVMMPAYESSPWSSIFFIVYISLQIFLFMKLFLAVIYSAFMTMEKEKLKKLLIHQREACRSAVKLLVTSQSPTAVSVKHFAGCMKYFRSRLHQRDVYLIFKLLNVSKTGRLSEDEFSSIYDVISLKWKHASSEPWSQNLPSPLPQICSGLGRVVSSKWFDFFIYAVISMNFIWIIVDVIRISALKSSYPDENFSWDVEEQRFLWCSIFFVVIYVIEAVMKIFGFGPSKYFSSGWNIFDFIVANVSMVGLVLQVVSSDFHVIALVRPLRVLRLFKLKTRFRDVFGTLFILFSRMVSLAVAMLLLYYSFAVIGMELFAHCQLKNCCINKSVEQYYMYDSVNNLDGYYYLNTFDNILASGVTLFELTVVNNWWIIMEGYANVISEWSRIYFMTFYLIIMIVMQVIVAFILEAFVFRIQYRMVMNGQDMDDHSFKRVKVCLSPDELQMCVSGLPLSAHYITSHASENETSGIMFSGKKLLSKNDFSQKMYQKDVEEWIAEYTASVSAQRNTIVQPSCEPESPPDGSDYTAVVV